MGGALEQFQVVIEKQDEFFLTKLPMFIVLNHKHSLIEVQVFRMSNDFLDVTTRLISVTAIAAIAIAVIIVVVHTCRNNKGITSQSDLLSL